MCCQGYQRDAHILRKCNPICTTECINGICFAPNECICYPDHVKNLADFCVPTCPIGEIEIRIINKWREKTMAKIPIHIQVVRMVNAEIILAFANKAILWIKRANSVRQFAIHHVAKEIVRLQIHAHVM